jgi:hypothetical protein
MPCRDYVSDGDTGWNRERYKEQCDKLARIACAAMTELEKVGKADFLVLKDDELRNWWEAHKEADCKERARIAEIERQERVKQEALDRLTDEEKELLGLVRIRKKRTIPRKEVSEWEINEEHDLGELLLDINKTYKGWQSDDL